MKIKYKVMATLNAIMGLLFLFAVVVQYNDPDWLRWMLIYGGAAISSFLWLTNIFNRILPLIIMLIALIWMSIILPDVIRMGTFSTHMFDSFAMHNVGIEEAREVGGLIIVAVWMAVIFWIEPPKQKLF